MINLVVFSGAVFLTAFVFLAAIPWMFKTLCLYGLHSLRDKTYDLGRRLPQITGTRVYQDVVFMQTNTIYSVRELGVVECLETVFDRLKDLPTRTNWRESAYANEIDECFSGREEREALEKMVDGVMLSFMLVLLRLVTSHPLVTLASIAALVVYVCKWLFDLASNTTEPAGLARKLARSMELSAH